jgi:hypothetical protein
MKSNGFFSVIRAVVVLLVLIGRLLWWEDYWLMLELERCQRFHSSNNQDLVERPLVVRQITGKDDNLVINSSD